MSLQPVPSLVAPKTRLLSLLPLRWQHVLLLEMDGHVQLLHGHVWLPDGDIRTLIVLTSIIGTVICHKFKDGKIKAVVHESSTLIEAEKYSQIEKKKGYYFCSEKFHKMIYGRKSIL